MRTRDSFSFSVSVAPATVLPLAVVIVLVLLRAGHGPEICGPGQAGLFWKWTGPAGPGWPAGQNRVGLV